MIMTDYDSTEVDGLRPIHVICKKQLVCRFLVLQPIVFR
jgi:hypothetical protein